MLAAYSAKATDGKSAYVLAVTDFLKPPRISEISVAGYNGQPGDVIRVVAFDDFMVVDVKVKLLGIFDIPFPRAAALFSFMAGIVSIWVHLEISLAGLNVEIVNIKQDMVIHTAANQKDLEALHDGQHSNTREILQKIDEIQIYLRDQR